VGENITECEQDYQTAIWMLEAILQIRPSEEITIEEDDRRIINKCWYTYILFSIFFY
jgi:serine/threonine-protein kinase ULK/ATG1